jgi:hypothetical protein
LSRFIVDKTGTELEILYLGLNEDCLSKIEDYCHQEKINVATITDSNSHIINGPSGAKQVEERIRPDQHIHPCTVCPQPQL